jgi:phosphatidylglycerol:prolipoprotein diacylglycerol transferase
MGYGCFRFIAEYFREPDSFLRDLPATTGLSMGQWLCVPMIVGGALVWAWATRRARPVGSTGARA